MTSLGWLKHKNANGADIYVRPHGSVGLLLVDDVTPATLQQLYADGLDPAAVVLTSTDNYQAWVRVAASRIAEAPSTAAARELARRYGGDLVAAKWRQYGRLAGFTTRQCDHYCYCCSEPRPPRRPTSSHRRRRAPVPSYPPASCP
jgi:hypothetical protein